MGLKDNFFQAMKELFGGEGAAAETAEKQAAAPEAPLFTREEAEHSAPAVETSPEAQFEDRMRDMLKSSGLVGSDLQAQAQTPSGLDSNLRMAQSAEPQASFAAPSFPKAPEPAPAPTFTQQAQPVRFTAPVEAEPSFAPPRFAAPAPEQPKYTAPAPAPEQPRYTAPVTEQPRYTAPYAPQTEQRYGGSFYNQAAEQDSFARSGSASAELTVISKNTLVTGNIRSFAGIYVEGNVSGNIEVVKNADINGKIIGNVTCSDARLNGALIQGDVVCKGRVFMDKNAMLVGNIGGQSMDVDGKVKGNLEVGGRIGLRENSVVIGNINAGTIAISDGANVQGFINTSFLRENADKVFPEQITLVDEESAFNQPRA